MSATRYCTSCQADRDLEGGIIKRTRSASRWICKSCLERKTVSIYKNTSGRPADVKKIMAALWAKRSA